MWIYTLLNQDGTKEELAQVEKEVDIKQLYKWLNCSLVELIPSDYYQLEWLANGKEVIVWGDEEGRFNSENHRNPHTKVLGENWDCVGNLILAQEV